MEFFHVGSCDNVEDNRKFGIFLYRNAVPRELNIPERLESAIGNSSHELFKWSEAMVGLENESSTLAVSYSRI
jgi:hypothetical protein